jgi:hypothetical protein
MAGHGRGRGERGKISVEISYKTKHYVSSLSSTLFIFTRDSNHQSLLFSFLLLPPYFAVVEYIPLLTIESLHFLNLPSSPQPHFILTPSPRPHPLLALTLSSPSPRPLLTLPSELFIVPGASPSTPLVQLLLLQSVLPPHSLPKIGKNIL